MSYLDQVRENLKKLDTCPRHDFDFDEDDNTLTVATCKSCGGQLRVVSAIWYRRGLQDGLGVAFEMAKKG